MRWPLALVVLGGCGRIAFDELVPADTPPADPLCLTDTFDAGATSWQSVVGAFGLSPTGGPDGSAVLRTAVNSNENLVTHPALAGVDAAHVVLDFAIDNAATGDFNVYFLTGTLGTRDDAYEVGLFPTTGDNPPDEIAFLAGGVTQSLAAHAPVLDAMTWHHVDVLRRTDGSIRVELDGAPYMESPPDATYGPPFTIAFRMFNQGRIDNVSVDCTR